MKKLVLASSQYGCFFRRESRLSLENVISKRITLSVWVSFKESLFTWFGKNKDEYNEKFIEQIKELLDDN